MDPSNTAPLSVVRAAYAALDAHDVAGMLALTDPAVTVDQSTVLPWGGHHEGHQGLLAFVGAVAKHLDSKVEVIELFAAGDRVVQVGRTRGHAVGTGRTFDAAEVHVWRIRDGRIVALEVYADTDVLGDAIAVDPPTA